MIICFSSISYFSKIDRQREFAVRLRELKQGLCDNLARWDGEGDGMEGGGMGVPTDKKKRTAEEFPGAPVVKTLCFHCRGHELNSASCMVWPKKKKKIEELLCDCTRVISLII